MIAIIPNIKVIESYSEIKQMQFLKTGIWL